MSLDYICGVADAPFPDRFGKSANPAIEGAVSAFEDRIWNFVEAQFETRSGGVAALSEAASLTLQASNVFASALAAAKALNVSGTSSPEKMASTGCDSQTIADRIFDSFAKDFEQVTNRVAGIRPIRPMR